MPQVSPEHSETDQERLDGEVKHTNVIMVFPHSCSEKGGIVMPVSHMMKGTRTPRSCWSPHIWRMAEPGLDC